MVSLLFPFTYLTSPLGICDCCDGSDEVGSPFNVVCGNSCKQSLFAFQRETLAEYKTLSSGLQARNELVNLMKRRKLRDQQSYLSLVAELEETEKVYYRMRVHLEKEEAGKEAALQFQELRRRVRECADQFLPLCDIFGDGGAAYEMADDSSLPIHLFGGDEEGEEEFLRDSSISSEGGKATEKEAAQREAEVAAAQKKDSQRDEVRKTTMTALQRVHSSYCSYLEQDVRGLLPEETPRVHKSVQQYLAYTSGRGGQADKKRSRSVEMIRKKNTLFGPFLDNGREGHILAAQVLCELLGIFLSPLTMPLTVAHHATNRLISAFWLQMKDCSISHSGSRGEEEEDETECPAWKVSLAKSLREGGTLSRVLDALDFSQYNSLVRLQKSWAPYSSALRWYWTLIQQAPWYYSRYYLSPVLSSLSSALFGGGKGAGTGTAAGIGLLPVKRDACTLREGIRVATEEMAALREKIQSRRLEEENNKKQQRQETEVSGSVSLDFSKDGSWEALQGLCLEKQEGEYLYKVCLFDSVFQGSTRLGSFRGWGDRLRYPVPLPSGEQKKKRFGSKVSSLLQKAQAAAGLTRGGSGGEGEEERDTDYTQQLYDGGDRCHNGIIRHAIVSFSCNTASLIEEVTEYEVSLLLLLLLTSLSPSLVSRCVGTR
jgi:hypothetical protein